MNPSLVIRADASSQMGTGHVMRCLALAEPWLESGSAVHLLSAQLPPALEKLARQRGLVTHAMEAVPGSAEDAQQLAQKVRDLKAGWAVVDGYQFDPAYQQHLKQQGVAVLLVDDLGYASHYSAGFILNQNLGATAAWYPRREPYTKLLMGTRFVQLRGEFTKILGTEKPVPARAKNILVTLGGSDTMNVTAKVLTALQRLPELSATVVVGGSYPHWESLQASAASSSNIRLVRQAPNMPELMAETDLAVAAGGTTAWELAYLGVPMLTIVQADNQLSNAKQLTAAGVTVNLGWHESLQPEALAESLAALAADEDSRSAMSVRARRLVDGRGSVRVWLYLNETAVRFRPATEDDCRRVWEWSNEPGARAASFNSALIPWDGHVNWYRARLADSRCLFWIATDTHGEPLGQVRFDLDGGRATISVSLDASRRGKNLGALTVWSACRTLVRQHPGTVVDAFIKQANVASLRAFQKAGFELTGQTEVKGGPACRLSWTAPGADA